MKPLTDRLKISLFDIFLKRWGRPFAHFQLKKRCVFRLLRGSSFASILEIGCQDGLLSLMIGRKFPVNKIVGIDLNERTIRTGNEMGAKLPDLNAEFLVMDMDRISLTQTFDLVLMIDTLQFSSEPQVLLQRIHRLLAPEGKLILYVPTHPQQFVLFRLPFLRRAFLPSFDERSRFDAEQVLRLVESAGFAVERRVMCYHKPAMLAKECHYMSAKLHPMLAACLFPLLNLLTLFDGGKRPGSGLFLGLSKRPQ